MSIYEFLGVTPEQYHKGFKEFLENEEQKLIVDGATEHIFGSGIPQGKITMMVGSSKFGSYQQRYVKHLLHLKQSK
jgi:hypothetical protein